jgi:putative endonuclease
MVRHGYTYILSNKNRTTLYIGVTSDIQRRILEHKCGYGSRFCARYKLVDLLFYEEHPLITDAIAREKQLKRWHRDWKWNLIKEQNPELNDIAKDWFSAAEICDYKEMLKRVQHDNV